MNVSSGVRRATGDDKPVLAAVMARAFERDPVLGGWVFREPATRRARLEALFAMALSDSEPPDHDLLTTDDRAGVALWHLRRPAAEDAEPEGDEEGGFGAAMLAAGFLAEESDRMLTFAGVMGDAHPHEPEHWYLNILAADTDRQGQGLGSACITCKLVDVDGAGLPAYLESTNEKNVPLYERHGFRTTSVIELPDGPAIWAMWRDARRT